jgi:cyclopropane-fatty-acyl-phospholipid synthase
MARCSTLGPATAPAAAITFKNWNVCSAALKSGDIGFAESYIAGDWTTPHLTDLLKLFIANRQQVEGVIYGTWAGRLLYRIKHLLNRNTRANSQKNIHAHYDLGNAFYELWLDDTMNYSSAWFEGDAGGDMRAPPSTPRCAARCAWPACSRVTACWRSAAAGAHWPKWPPPNWAPPHGRDAVHRTARVCAKAHGAHGGGGQADLRLQDYRDIDDGPYDAICSIEMVEAVGREYWPTYFASRSSACSSPVARPASRAS